MDIKSNKIPIEGLPEATSVSLKWMRGANRYNNGATKYGKKYQLRLLMSWAGQRKVKRAKGKHEA